MGAKAIRNFEAARHAHEPIMTTRTESTASAMHPEMFSRAFAIGTALNIGFVIVEAASSIIADRWHCSQRPGTVPVTCSACCSLGFRA